MEASLQQLSQNPLAVSMISLVVGSLLTFLFTSLRQKSGVLGYTVTWKQIGISADDAIFGRIRVHWGDSQVRNLFVYTVEVENVTARDYEDVDLHFYSGSDTLIMNERTQVVGEPRNVEWSPEFKSKLHVAEGGTPSERQLLTYNQNREYRVPVLNRGQKLTFTFLCTKPNDDSDPNIFLSTASKGIRLKRLPAPFVVVSPILGVPTLVGLYRGLVIAVVVVVLCSLLIERAWIAAPISLAVGLSAQFLGALLYRIECSVKGVLTR